MKKILIALSLTALAACSSGDNSSIGSGSYDRTALMTSWADNIIIPSFTNYQAKVADLDTKATAFAATPGQASLDAVRASWLEGYKAYQHIGIFDSPRADDLNLILGSNTYPTDVAGINANISSGSYNLAQSSQFAREGFPALDYLLFGVAGNDAAIIDYYTTNAAAKAYLKAVTANLKTVADALAADWNGTYRDTFVAGTGTSVSSAINQTVNNFVKNLEKDVRAPKIGIPAGLFSNGTTFPDKVEAYYKNNVSKVLLNEAINSSKDFFNGKYFGAATTGPGLKGYLDAVNAQANGQKLSDIINAQYDASLAASALLSDSFSSQVTTDNSKMVDAYNALQLVVVYTKVNMLSSLNISIDYVDGDGD